MKPLNRKEIFLEALAKGETVNIKPLTREEKLLMQQAERESKGGGAQADWNAAEGEPGHVLNRTHYEVQEVVNEPLNITWDGNTEGLVSVAGELYKVSDAVLTDEQIKSATFVFNGSEVSIEGFWEELVASGSVTDEIVIIEAVVVLVRKAGATVGSIVFPETGIYFAIHPAGYVSSLTTTEPVEYIKTVVHKLDSKYIPDNDNDNDIVFTGVFNADGLREYYCNTPYAKARAALKSGATARMILVDDNEITHLVLQWVRINNGSVNLNFFDIKDTDIHDGIINYYSDGTIGSGLE